MKFSTIATFTSFALVTQASIVPVYDYQQENGVLTGQSYNDLLNILGIDSTSANELGLFEGEKISTVVEKLNDLANAHESNNDKRDLGAILELIKIKKELILEAISALLTGKIIADKSGYLNLLDILQINKTEAIELGLTEGKGTFDLVKQLGDILQTEISLGFSYGKRDLGAVLELIKIKKELILEAISALLTGKITADKSGYLNLLDILQINKTEAIELGLTEGKGTFDLVKQLGDILQTEISLGFSYGKRDLGAVLELIKIKKELILEAISALLTGKITADKSGYLNLLDILQINKTEAIELGLTEGKGTFDLVKQLGDILQTEISLGFSYGKRDLGAVLELIKIKKELILEAISALLTGKITADKSGYLNLLDILQINKTEAIELGLTEGKGTFDLVKQLGDILQTEISLGFSYSKRDLGAILELIKIKKELILEAISALLTGKITADKSGYLNLLDILQINKTEAIELGLTEGKGTFDLVKQLGDILQTEISLGFSYSKRDLGAILELIKIKKELILEAISALLTGKITADKSGYLNLLDILQINKTEAIELGLTEGKGTFDLVKQLGDILQTEISLGFSYGKDKRDLGAILELIKIKKELILEAISALLTGKITADKSGYLNLLDILQINKTEAIELGLTEGEGTFDLVKQLGDILKTEISLGFSF
ncbi:uncharacterized protein KGF55_003229 [Candida pseudojiufengensis]|uniref:uncharacterized protein n=1 Tax=Candida pseudojiufengensis TaxID=497109 RepID=UPI0022257A67|nr:uncharacterized protein KGF55_003229 [Candida pseudojiufengensis]KAI5962153.1 hypothetical protein KGF55_003229 [Candida pseudojiufengensis]